jgi:Lar family restriction alleviation protein
MTAPELKPCPFCGSSSNLDWTRHSYVSCDNCDVFGPSYDYPMSAISAWNTRTATIPDPLDDPRVKALVEAMKNVAEQSTRDEIPDGYGPDHVDGFDDGYDAAIMNCRAALSTITKEPPHER